MSSHRPSDQIYSPTLSRQSTAINEDDLEGLPAQTEMYRKYKKLNKYQETSRNTTFTGFLTDANKRGLVPEPLVAQRKWDRRDINLNDVSIGNEYAQMMA